MIFGITLCSLPGNLPACDNCQRNTQGKQLPNADESQSWLYPRKGMGSCEDQLKILRRPPPPPLGVKRF